MMFSKKENHPLVLSKDNFIVTDNIEDAIMVYTGSDLQFDVNASSGGYFDAVANAKTFVNGGGTVIATGKSSAFPALLGGVGSPSFYYFSGTGYPRPYGSATNKAVDIKNAQIKEMLGGVSSVTLSSPLPQSQHSLIEHPGASRVLATGLYGLLNYITTPWGVEPEIIPITVPTAIEYEVGSNGGKVTYSNIELAPNYASGGLPQTYVDALLDPILFKGNDEEDIAEALGGDYYGDPEARPLNYRAMNLNMVVYNGGVTLNNTKTNADVSFAFTVLDRMANSPAPPIDSSGDPELVISLYKPSGELYATHSAIPGDGVISIGVPTGDNDAAGDWKFVVDEVHGFEGMRVAAVSVSDGINNIYDDDGGEDGPWDTIERGRSATRPQYLRGVVDGAFYHQLGDGQSEVKTGTADRIAFGGLIRSSDVRIWRIDDDLVLEVMGAPDKVTVPDWFSNKRGASGPASPSEVLFHDGATLSSEEIASRAVVREPDVRVILVSSDKYIYGTDGSDTLTGAANQNSALFGGPGDDTLIGNGWNNVYYYNKGWGSDVVNDKKNPGEYGILRFHDDITSRDVAVSRVGDDMKFSIAGGSVTVLDWFSDENARLGNVQFVNGEVWDERDLEALAGGGQLAAREQVLFAPDLDRLELSDNAQANDVNNGGGSGCNAGAAALLVLACAAVCGIRKELD
ncbi:MAG: hypothetical protein LBQ58_05610 [Synergistaceae bacterium]|nr:hypothetical protein [Synergistaceae bacterium]